MKTGKEKREGKRTVTLTIIPALLLLLFLLLLLLHLLYLLTKHHCLIHNSRY